MGKLADTLVEAGHNVVSLYTEAIQTFLDIVDSSNLWNGRKTSRWNEKSEDSTNFPWRRSRSYGVFIH